MLVYLDALIDALHVRDGVEAERLLAHPLSRLLPDDVRQEARTFVDGDRDALAAPLRALHLRHQTAELLRAAPLADRAEPPLTDDTTRQAPPPSLARRGTRAQQIELPLSA
jgi:hypothetical protein